MSRVVQPAGTDPAHPSGSPGHRLAGCSSSSKSSAAPSTGGGATPAGNNGGATPAGGNGGTSELSGAVTALSDINSYKFSMTLAGGDFGSMLSALGGAGASGNAPFTMTARSSKRPTAAADITMAGFHIIEVGGTDYLDMGGSGSFISYPATGTSMADSFAPSTMFSSMMDPPPWVASPRSGPSRRTASPPITTRPRRQRLPTRLGGRRDRRKPGRPTSGSPPMAAIRSAWRSSARPPTSPPPTRSSSTSPTSTTG